MALHKDPNDLTKLRPICIGGLIARLVEKVLAKHFAAEAACFLLDNNQVAINVKGGVEALIHAFTAALEALEADEAVDMSQLMMFDFDAINAYNMVVASTRGILFGVDKAPVRVRLSACYCTVSSSTSC